MNLIAQFNVLVNTHREFHYHYHSQACTRSTLFLLSNQTVYIRGHNCPWGSHCLHNIVNPWLQAGCKIPRPRIVNYTRRHSKLLLGLHHAHTFWNGEIKNNKSRDPIHQTHNFPIYITHRFHMPNTRVERSSHYLTWHHPIWIGSIIHDREKSVHMPGIAYQRHTILPLIGMPTQWRNIFF